MYSLAMLLVTLTAIYAYRIYNGANEHKGTVVSRVSANGAPTRANANVNIKNWVIFAICSLAGAYTHYYALMASGLINLILLIGLIVNCIKNGDQRAQWCHL